MIASIIFGVLWIITMIAAGLYVKAEQAIKKDIRKYETFIELQNWAEIAVRWAQDRLGDQMGHNRRIAAINALKEIRDKLGIDISDDQIGMLISSAYAIMTEKTIVSETLPDKEIEMPDLSELELGVLEKVYKDELE